MWSGAKLSLGQGHSVLGAEVMGSIMSCVGLNTKNRKSSLEVEVKEGCQAGLVAGVVNRQRDLEGGDRVCPGHWFSNISLPGLLHACKNY